MTTFDKFCCLSYTNTIFSLKSARHFRAKKPPCPSRRTVLPSTQHYPPPQLPSAQLLGRCPYYAQLPGGKEFPHYYVPLLLNSNPHRLASKRSYQCWQHTLCKCIFAMLTNNPETVSLFRRYIFNASLLALGSGSVDHRVDRVELEDDKLLKTRV
jgi:hypothetical protein